MHTQEQLRDLFRMIKTFKTIGSPRDTYRRDAVRAIRRSITNNILVDPYMERRDKKAYLRDDFNNHLVITVGTMWAHDTRVIESKNIWIDDYKKWLQNPFKYTLHFKNRYIRVNDDFYDRNEYLEYEGKAYLKKDYVIYKEKLVEKSKVCLIKYYDYGNDYTPGKYKEIVLMADEGEEMIDDCERNEAVIGIEIAPPYNSCHHLKCTEFIKSMFRIGDKRLKPDDGYMIFLTKDDLNKFNFKFSESHAIEMAKAMEEAVTIQDSIRFGAESIMSKINDVHFRIFLCNNEDYKGTSLKQKLINLIVRKCGRRRYTTSFSGLKELFIRLRAFKGMLDTEAEYAR